MLEAIFSVFNELFVWLVARTRTATAIFYRGGSLTFFGYMALAALGISLFFLLMRVVQNFLRFRS